MPEGAGAARGIPLVDVAVFAATVHLLVAGLLGFGVQLPSARPPVAVAQPPAPTEIFEPLELLPPEQPEELVEEPPVEVAEEPLPAAVAIDTLDLPPIPDLQPIAVVAADVPVAFALPVSGPARVVKDAREASGAVGRPQPKASPISLDQASGLRQNLLQPTVQYPSGRPSTAAGRGGPGVSNVGQRGNL